MSDVQFNGCPLSSTGMPQLNLREVFAAAPDETGPLTPEFAVLPDPVLTHGRRARSRLGHSEWTNIGFVTIAFAGGLFSAFYFFNGADVLRAAGRWSQEFLYPPPRTAPVNAAGPVAENVTSASATSTSQNRDNSNSGPFGGNYWPGDVAPPAPFASANAVGANGSVGNAGGFVVGSALDQLNTLQRGGDNLFQTLYQTTPADSRASGATQTVRKTVASPRKRVRGAGNLVLQRTPVVVRSISNSNTASTSQDVQQTTNAAQFGRSPLGFGPGLGTRAAGGGGLGSVGGALGGLGGGRAGR